MVEHPSFSIVIKVDKLENMKHDHHGYQLQKEKPGRAGQDQMVLESQDGQLVDLRLFCRHHNL